MNGKQILWVEVLDLAQKRKFVCVEGEKMQSFSIQF